ncbi:hypothetical protein AB1Y20_023087 [Prymnesium parvum]|uniref:Calmodulin n=1 Tax=Prymnesium parvum TaxID=97485 RepID=A0AB34JDT0_PRYPA
MPPSSWKPCSYCGQPFGASSLAIHMQRCRFRPEIASEMALREEEGYSRPSALPDWIPCPNCGEQYGKIAMPAHVKKCKRLRPNGANGHCATTAADHKSHADYAEKLIKKGETDADRLRALFGRFDADKDGCLNIEESAACLRQCFPTRCEDVEAIAAMFDKDRNGLIDFNEFIQMHNELAGGATRFDEASDMFQTFDTDKNGKLDPKEFESLLHQVFPKHCDEIDQILKDEFNLADRDHDGGISFPEFCGYYDRLMDLFPDDGEEHEDVHADLVPCVCGNTFLPEKLPVHQRSCPAFQAAADAEAARREAAAAKAEAAAARAAMSEAEAARARALAEAEKARRDAAAAATPKNPGSRPSSGRAKSPAREAPSGPEAGFVPCKYCGRRFFPDRLPVHLRVCNKKKELQPSMCRATVTDGKSLTVGRYGNDGPAMM